MAHPHDSPFHSFLAKMEVAVEMDVKAVFVKLRHFRVSNINLEKNYLYLK
jgi:hypothetical protein